MLKCWHGQKRRGSLSVFSSKSIRELPRWLHSYPHGLTRAQLSQYWFPATPAGSRPTPLVYVASWELGISIGYLWPISLASHCSHPPSRTFFPRVTFLFLVPQTHLRFCRFPRTLPRKHCSKHYHHYLCPSFIPFPDWEKKNLYFIV